VKDVCFAETMNTTTLAGDHITMQQVIVKHKYFQRQKSEV